MYLCVSVYFQSGLICLDDRRPEQFIFHPIPNQGKIPFGVTDDPVTHYPVENIIARHQSRLDKPLLLHSVMIACQLLNRTS